MKLLNRHDEYENNLNRNTVRFKKCLSLFMRSKCSLSCNECELDRIILGEDNKHVCDILCDSKRIVYHEKEDMELTTECINNLIDSLKFLDNCCRSNTCCICSIREKCNDYKIARLYLKHNKIRERRIDEC